ncbi:MAG: hypothetical protein WCH86_07145 [Kiritimatiellales bacterium]
MNPQGWHAANLLLHAVLVYLLCLAFLKENRRRYAVAALLFVLGMQTFVYSTVWRGDLALWHHAFAQDENNAQSCNSMGKALMSRQAYEKAVEYFIRRFSAGLFGGD